MTLFLNIIIITSLEDYLLSSNLKVNDTDQLVLRAIQEKDPQTIEQLVKILEANGLKEKSAIESIKKLDSEGKIKLANTSESTSSPYEVSDALWYMLTIAIGLIACVLIFTISANAYPWSYARNVLGTFFVLFLPGYAFVKAFFRINKSEKVALGSLETIIKIVLSFGVSIAIVSIIGLILYYTQFGLNLTNIVLTIFVITSVFATVALVLDNRVRRKI